MVAYFIVAVPALLTAMVLSRKGGHASRTERWGQIGLGLALLVGILAFVFWPEGFRDRAHTTSAILMFIGILAVVGVNAWGAQESERATGGVGYRNAYIGIGALMIVTFVVLGGLHFALDDWRHGVLAIEAALLIEFLAFWIVQTFELWKTTRRRLPADAPPALAA